MRLVKAILMLLAVLVAVPVSLLLIGWMFSFTYGYYIFLALISIISFIGWRRRTERFGNSSEYMGLKSRIEWLQEKDNPFKHR